MKIKNIFLFIFIAFLTYSCLEDKIKNKSNFQKVKYLEGAYEINQLTGDKLNNNFEKNLIVKNQSISFKKLNPIKKDISDELTTTFHKIDSDFKILPNKEEKKITYSFSKKITKQIKKKLNPIVKTFKQVIGINTNGFKPLVNEKNDLRSLSVAEGLESPFVQRTIKDKANNLWIATSSGISKFDGNKIYNYSENEGFVNDRFECIYEDNKGNLWFGTLGSGLLMFDGIKITHYNLENGFFNSIYNIFQDHKGSIWFSTEKGVAKFENGLFYFFDSSNGLVDSFVNFTIEGPNNTFFFGVNGYGIIVLKEGVFYHYKSDSGLQSEKIISGLYFDQKLYLGTYGDGLVIVNFKTSKTKQYKEIDGLLDNYIFDLKKTTNGKILLCHYFSGIEELNKQILKSIYNAENKDLSSIAVERDNIFISTRGSGLQYLKQAGFNSNFIKLNGVEEKIDFIEAKDEEYVYFSSEDNSLNILKGLFLTKIKPIKFENYYANFVKIDSKKNIWLGAYNELFKIQIKGKKSKCIKYNIGAFDFFEDHNNRFWIFDQSRVIIFKDDEFYKFNLPKNIKAEEISKIYQDKSNVFYFLTYNYGMYILKDGKFKNISEKDGLSSNKLSDIVEVNNTLWISTYNKGLIKFDKKYFYYFTEKDGLLSDKISDLNYDKYGKIYTLTSKGICVVNEHNKRIDFDIMDINDGTKGNYFVAANNFIDSKNYGFWENESGLIFKKLDQRKTNPLRVNINTIYINDEFIDYRNLHDTLKNKIKFKKIAAFENYPKDCKFENILNTLSFQFSAPDWDAPHKVKYKYYLEGYDQKIIFAKNSSNAIYRNLPPGKFKFRIKAKGESNKWSNWFDYQFEILPPWHKTWWAYGLYLIIFVTSIFGLVDNRTKKLKKKQLELESIVSERTSSLFSEKLKVEHKNREILDSITYAKRIQSAILPQPKLVKEFLEDSFILYKPKDIVAGDFYWLEVVGETVLFAAADCTGHGVPGAMVSVVCNNGLNRAVREHKLTEPDQILNKTRELVVEEFEKSDEEVKDGMDISLCALDTKTNTLKWAGANNPLWILRNGEIIEKKGDKQPIGKHFDAKPFSLLEYQLEKDDIIYIFTDGFQDQFGGPKEKKFRVAQMRELFLSLTSKTMEEQRKIINESFENWKGVLEQVDDVCVIGVRI